MSRRTNGFHYEFVAIRDRGDGVIGLRDLIILKDEDGRRHEYYLGDEQAQSFLHDIGLEAKDLSGMSCGQAQNRLSYLHHMKCAMRKAQAGDSAGLDEALQQAERCARMAEMTFDMGKAQEIRAMARHHH
jgi:hypothetical protein